jgi:hypothetical protein
LDEYQDEQGIGYFLNHPPPATIAFSKIAATTMIVIIAS